MFSPVSLSSIPAGIVALILVVAVQGHAAPAAASAAASPSPSPSASATASASASPSASATGSQSPSATPQSSPSAASSSSSPNAAARPAGFHHAVVAGHWSYPASTCTSTANLTSVGGPYSCGYEINAAQGQLEISADFAAGSPCIAVYPGVPQTERSQPIVAHCGGGAVDLTTPMEPAGIYTVWLNGSSTGSSFSAVLHWKDAWVATAALAGNWAYPTSRCAADRQAVTVVRTLAVCSFTVTTTAAGPLQLTSYLDGAGRCLLIFKGAAQPTGFPAGNPRPIASNCGAGAVAAVTPSEPAGVYTAVLDGGVADGTSFAATLSWER